MHSFASSFHYTLRSTLLAALLLSLVPLQDVQAAPNAQLAPDKAAIAQEVNGTRAQFGLHTLVLSPQLNEAAQRHVDDMFVNGNWGHYGSDGSTVGQRVVRTGYALDGWASENWVSVSTPERAMVWWMNSTVHRGNILNSNWSEFGVGGGYHEPSNRYVYVLVFATGHNGEHVAAAAAPAEVAAAVPVHSAPEVVQAAQPAPAQSAPTATQSVEPTYVAIQAPQYPVRDYTIQTGDTISSLALRLGMDWRELAAINGLDAGSVLQIGQTMQVPASGVLAPSVEVPQGPVQTYTVQAGDTISTIAAYFGSDWQSIAALNQLSENSVLQIGQTVRVPDPMADATAPPTSTGERLHTVASGETIISIAARYSVDWQTLLSVNNLSDAAVLQLGQQLRLP